jgi:hypothetical protein
VRGARGHERGLELPASHGLGKRQALKAAWTYKSVNVLEQAQKHRKNKVIHMRILERVVVDLSAPKQIAALRITEVGISLVGFDRRKGTGYWPAESPSSPTCSVLERGLSEMAVSAK